MYKISRRELWSAQAALFLAIGLQIVTWQFNHSLVSDFQTFILVTEIILAILIGFTVNKERLHNRGLHHRAVLILLALISAANISSFIIVVRLLITDAAPLEGLQLLTSALAIFITNIIVFALWYWEIDSPGLTLKRWSKHDKDFQFIQQDLKGEFPGWRPTFVDYLYLSLTNAINFAPADTKPLTHSAKTMMGLQALISSLTLALVLARAVGILT